MASGDLFLFKHAGLPPKAIHGTPRGHQCITITTAPSSGRGGLNHAISQPSSPFSHSQPTIKCPGQRATRLPRQASRAPPRLAWAGFGLAREGSENRGGKRRSQGGAETGTERCGRAGRGASVWGRAVPRCTHHYRGLSAVLAWGLGVEYPPTKPRGMNNCGLSVNKIDNRNVVQVL